MIETTVDAVAAPVLFQCREETLVRLHANAFPGESGFQQERIAGDHAIGRAGVEEKPPAQSLQDFENEEILAKLRRHVASVPGCSGLLQKPRKCGTPRVARGKKSRSQKCVRHSTLWHLSFWLPSPVFGSC